MKFYTRSRRVLFVIFLIVIVPCAVLVQLLPSSENNLADELASFFMLLFFVGMIVLFWRSLTGYVLVDERGLKIRNPFFDYFVPWEDYERIGVFDGGDFRDGAGPALYVRNGRAISLVPVLPLFPGFSDGDSTATAELKACIDLRFQSGAVDGVNESRDATGAETFDEMVGDPGGAIVQSAHDIARSELPDVYIVDKKARRFALVGLVGAAVVSLVVITATAAIFPDHIYLSFVPGLATVPLVMKYVERMRSRVQIEQSDGHALLINHWSAISETIKVSEIKTLSVFPSVSKSPVVVGASDETIVLSAICNKSTDIVDELIAALRKRNPSIEVRR